MLEFFYIRIFVYIRIDSIIYKCLLLITSSINKEKKEDGI